MRKTFIRGVVAGFALLLMQNGFAQTRVGIFAGGQATSAKYMIVERYSQQREKQPTSQKAGVQVGGVLKVPFERQLHFAPAMYYSMKGYKVTLNRSAEVPHKDAVNNETQIHTVEIAPMLQYDFSAKRSHFFVKAGPAIDIAVSGKESFDTKDSKHVDRAMKFSYEDYGYFTAQAVVHFGFEAANGLFVFAHYAHGFGSLNNNDDGPIIFHRVAGLSLGWYLNGNK